MRTQYARLLKSLRKRYSEEQLRVVQAAYACAVSAHEGQKRLSKEPYVMHSLNVGVILASIGLDPTTVAAGLLHDVLEDTPYPREEMLNRFGPEIVSLVDAVTNIKRTSRKIPEKEESYEVKQAQNIRKMLVATAQDVRVILIKLADRLHNMRTIDALPPDRRKRMARETMDIYAPMADRLGISMWKWELEDLSFRQLLPEKYREVSELVAVKRREREVMLNEVLRLLQKRLHEAGIQSQVIGRSKHLYSIHTKMERQGKTFEEVMDIEGVRIITKTHGECYEALGTVHNVWPPIPGRFKDYIAVPKFNMYRAIHTTVMRENGKPLEIQIRSEEMDRTAREGIAAHWIYKEGRHAQDPRLERQLKWLRQMFEWLKDAHAPDDFMDSVAREFTPSHIYVFTPRGEVKELPKGATPLDFAYNIHSDIGHHCIGARVNARMVPLSYNLQTSDFVEILTSKNQRPHLDWVDLVVTGKARCRIRQRLRELGEIEAEEPQKQEKEEPAIGHRRGTLPTPPQRDIPQVDDATRQKLIRIEGGKGMAVQFAKCCNPMPGHTLVGYFTKTPGVTVHRSDCKSFLRSARDQSRIVQATWVGEGTFETALRVVVGSRPNILPDIMEALRPMNIEIMRAGYSPYRDGRYHFDFLFQVPDMETAELMARTLLTVSGVSEVTKLRRDNVETGTVARSL